MKETSLIFEMHKTGTSNTHLIPSIGNNEDTILSDIPAHLIKNTENAFPAVSELEVIRHYTRLSQKNMSIDTHFYPLGSCTMKYNPKSCHELAMQDGFLNRHPLSPDSTGQGILKCLYHLQNIIQEVVGMDAVCLTPMAGAQGEFAGLLTIHAFHKEHNQTQRNEILVPDNAHGTNPASASMLGYRIRIIATQADGNLDMESLKKNLSDKTAGLMLTNPSTLGVFEQNILEITRLVHEAGGLLYYDGANLNAILGYVRPGDMGFDVMHINFHKTFSTPHGGGGPGAAIVATKKTLAPYLPIGHVLYKEDKYYLSSNKDQEKTVGRLSAFTGNIGVLLRAYTYIRQIGKNGMKRISFLATLNANYLAYHLAQIGYTLPYKTRRAGHEFVVSCHKMKKETGVTAMDVAKRLLDMGCHAPTCYFPTIIPESLLIEPTETESKETLDLFISAMASIYQEAYSHPDILKTAPHHRQISRPDEIKAATDLDLCWKSTRNS